MTANHFPPHKGREFYKFLPERSLDYYKEGSFQFGSIQYYRGIEQQNSKDLMEGLLKSRDQDAKTFIRDVTSVRLQFWHILRHINFEQTRTDVSKIWT